MARCCGIKGQAHSGGHRCVAWLCFACLLATASSMLSAMACQSKSVVSPQSMQLMSMIMLSTALEMQMPDTGVIAHFAPFGTSGLRGCTNQCIAPQRRRWESYTCQLYQGLTRMLRRCQSQPHQTVVVITVISFALLYIHTRGCCKSVQVQKVHVAYFACMHARSLALVGAARAVKGIVGCTC